jgi:WD40 repeat protein
VWELATGRIRNVLIGHRGWSACVTCAEGPGLWPLALTGGLDNRVNVWDLRHGRRQGRLRIVSPWTFLIRPSAGQARVVRAMPLDRGKILALVITCDQMVRALEPRRFRRGAERAMAVPAQALETTTLSNGQEGIVTATDDGTIRLWKPEAFTRRGTGQAPTCEITIDVPVNDIAVIDKDTFALATPNGLTAVRFDAGLIDRYAHESVTTVWTRGHDATSS